MEHKAILGVFKAREDAKDLFIEGWANKAVVDRGGDIIPKDAWDLKNYAKNPIILFSHDKNQPIGRAVVTEAKDEGLYVKAKISKSDSPDIAKVRDLIKEGVLNAFSVGFDMRQSEKTADGYTEIKSAELFEVSVVAIPMNQDSTFSLTKSYDYEQLKALTTKAADEPANEDAKAAEVAPEEAPSEDPKEPLPSEDDAEGAKAIAPKESLEVEVQALCLPKSAYPDLDAAKAAATEYGWSVDTVEDDETDWCFVQVPADQFMSLSDVQLGEGAYVVVGVMKGEAEAESEGESEGESEDEPKVEVEIEASKSATVPLPSDAPQVNEPESIMQARQTNVLLGLVVTELQKLQSAILELSKAMPAQPAGQPVDVQPPKQLADEPLAPDTEIVREYLAEITKTLDRIGA